MAEFRMRKWEDGNKGHGAKSMGRRAKSRVCRALNERKKGQNLRGLKEFWRRDD
jgi:hypothetical protein